MKKFFLYLCLTIGVSQAGMFSWFAGRAAGMTLLPVAYLCAFMVVIGILLAASALHDLDIIKMPDLFGS